jgi:hypothetical protein
LSLPGRGPTRGPTPGGFPPRKRRVIVRPSSSGGMDPQTMKYLIFFLIFVVGNAILFFTTGFVIIPR